MLPEQHVRRRDRGDRAQGRRAALVRSHGEPTTLVVCETRPAPPCGWWWRRIRFTWIGYARASRSIGEYPEGIEAWVDRLGPDVALTSTSHHGHQHHLQRREVDHDSDRAAIAANHVGRRVGHHEVDLGSPVRLSADRVRPRKLKSRIRMTSLVAGSVPSGRPYAKKAAKTFAAFLLSLVAGGAQPTVLGVSVCGCVSFNALDDPKRLI
jgi:hypothetical protein